MQPPDRLTADPPARADDPFGSLLAVIRERWRVVVACMVLAAAGAFAYILVAPRTYEAQADLLVSPVPGDDPLTQGLPLIRAAGGSDPTRDVETAARLVEATEVARATREELSLTASAESILDDVTVEPVAQSDVLTVSATATSAGAARDLANAFAQAAVDQRGAALDRALDGAITRIEERIAQARTAGDRGIARSLAPRLAALEGMRGGPDPTLQFVTRATLPAAPEWPRPKLMMLAAEIVGLLLGIALALAAHALDRRVRDVPELARIAGAPVLAWVADRHARDVAPGVVRSPGLGGGMNGDRAPAALLVATPASSRRSRDVSFHLASSFAATGVDVILIASRGTGAIARGFRTHRRAGLVDVARGEADLLDCLSESVEHGPCLHLLTDGSESGGDMAGALMQPGVARVVAEVRALAGVTVIDATPREGVPGGLLLGPLVDRVLVVVRPGETEAGELTELLELAAAHGLERAGLVVAGAESAPGTRVARARRPRATAPQEG